MNLPTTHPASRTLIHLHLSNRFEALAAALAERVRRRREAAGVFAFEPVHVVAPNRGVRLGVHLELARRLGISANLRFVPVSEVALLALSPAERARTRVAGPWALQRVALDLLAAGDLLDAPELAPVARYLRHGEGAPDDGLDADALERRRVQLARRVAERLGAYGLSRPDLLATWRDGLALSPEHPLAETERWQRRLWLEVLARLADGARADGARADGARADGARADGARADDARADDARAGGEEAPRWRTEPDLVAQAAGAPAAPVDLPPELHVVGFTHLEPLRVDALASLARGCDVHVYALVPCLPDDAPGPVPGSAPGSAPGSVPGCDVFRPRPDEHPGVERWGRVALEQVALWRAAARRAGVACETGPLLVDDAARATLLTRLQRGLASRDGWRERAPAGLADGSLVVAACPDLWREVEVAAGEVWRAIDEAAARPDGGRPLRFSDVALVVAGRDVDRYRAAIATVFRQAHAIPVSFADGQPGDALRVVEAARLLVELPLGEFTRDELLRLVTHPSIVEAPGDVAARPDERRARRLEEVERWLAWSEALMVVRGADRHDHDGTYLARDLLSWDQGLRRLALGALMTGARSRDARPVELGHDAYAPLDLAHDELDPAARLTLLVRSLLADARFARGGARPLATWAEFLARLVVSYVVPADDADGELRGRCAAALRGLADLDDTSARSRPVSYRVAAELAARALDEVRPRAHDLADGVVVSAMSASRPLPARVVIVLGLNEGQVPRPTVHDDLDLRRTARRAGDAEPGELDAAAFLERVLGARERLVLSYVARDAQTGHALAPSSLVRELEHVLGEAGLLTSPRQALTVAHPLRRHDARGFAPGARPSPIPAAWREARAHALRLDLEAHLRRALPAGTPWPQPAELRRALAPAVRERLAALLGDAPPPIAPATSAASAASAADPRADQALRVSISALARFLESPLQGWGAHRLRLSQEEDHDVLAREDEPFACDALGSSALLRAAFGAGLLAAREGDLPLAEAVERAHADVALAAELEGRAPTGVFLDKVRDDHLGVLAAWVTTLQELGLEATALRAERFGPSWEDDAGPAPVEHAPLRVRLPAPLASDAGLPAGEREASVTGRTALIDPARATLVRLVQGAAGERHLLRAFVEALVLAAAGLLEGGSLRLLVVGGRGDPVDVTFTPPDAAAATAHLGLLLHDLLDGSHDHLLPGDAALEWLRLRLTADADPQAKVPGALADLVRGQRDDPFRRSADEFGPVRRPERFEPPADAEALARRRLEPLLRWTQGAGA